MSTNVNSFNTAANILDEVAHGLRISIPTRFRVSTYVLPSPPLKAARPAFPTTGDLHTIVNGPLPTVTGSRPHRAWEEGFQSPFSRTHRSLSPLPIDAQPRQVAYDGPRLEAPRILRRHHSAAQSTDVSTQHAPIRSSNLSSSSLPTDKPSVLRHPERTTHQRTSPYRPRMRRVVTKETTLDDNDIAMMVTLGLSPFMVNQDMIANQNRLVRNECVFARHLRRLQHATSDAEARHLKAERDIYRHLEQQKSTLDMLAKGFGPTTSASSILAIDDTLRAHPDFLALEKAHQETSARLEALSLQVVESSESTRRALMSLAKCIDQIIRTGTPCSTDNDASARSPAAADSPSLLLSPTNFSALRMKRSSSPDSILESPATMPPPTPDLRNCD